MDRQPRVTDLVPKKYSVLLLLFLAGLTVVAGLEALYAWMPELAAMTTDGRVAAFDLDGEGNLAGWFSSATLALAGLAAVLVYSIRRHRADDYHGRYRIWLWAAACWLLMSVDEGGSLHEGFKQVMAHVTGQSWFGDGSIWWIGPYVLVLGTVGLRLIVEMRGCRASTAALVATAGCYAAAVLAQLGWILPQSGARGVMVEEGCEMAGNLLLLLAMSLHARHVILDAQGRLPAREPRPPKAHKPPRSEKGATRQRRAKGPARRWFGRAQIDHAQPTVSPSPKTSDLVPARQRPDYPSTRAGGPRIGESPGDDQFAYDYTDDEFDPAGDDRRLTKAQRKALRRQKEREGRGEL